VPIEYSVREGGRFVHAIARGEVTNEEFIDYETKRGGDARVKASCRELLEVPAGVLRLVTREAIEEALSRRAAKAARAPHRCAIVVSYSDSAAWDLAKLFEKLAAARSPGSVVVFGDVGTAKTWLGASEP